jgi:LmbE family N-acetylglucosaminyl deacetylase
VCDAVKRKPARKGTVGPLGASRDAERVLVVAAHPDDEVLGCGGTMARHVLAGDQVQVVILGEGMMARAGRRDQRTHRAALSALQQQARQAAKLLGVAGLSTHAFPDNRFDTVALLDLIKVVELEKARVRPSIVYTHHPGDLNVDHRRVAEAVQTAFRPQPGDLAPVILAFEVSSSTEYQSPLAGELFRPTVYVDISATLEIKCKAMAAYASETRPYPHPRSLEALRVIARRNGIEVGLEAAERFALVRMIVRQVGNELFPRNRN